MNALQLALSASFIYLLQKEQSGIGAEGPVRSIYISMTLYQLSVDKLRDWLIIAREFIDNDFARFQGGYSSFLSIEPLSLIPLVQPSSRTCTIDATEIANSIIKEIRKRATIWHQISGGVERAAVRSGKTIKKRRLFVEVSTERPLGSGKRITITGT